MAQPPTLEAKGDRGHNTDIDYPAAARWNIWDLQANPVRLRTAAEAWRSLGDGLTETSDAIIDAAGQITDWAGDTAESYRTHRGKIVKDLASAGGIANEVAAQLDGIAADLETIQSALSTILSAVSCAYSMEGTTVTFHPDSDADVASIDKVVSDAESARLDLDSNLSGALSQLIRLTDQFDEITKAWVSAAADGSPTFARPLDFTQPHDPPGTNGEPEVIRDGNQIYLNTGNGNEEVTVAVDPTTRQRVLTVNGQKYAVPPGAELTIRTGAGHDRISVPEGTKLNLTILSSDGNDTVDVGGGNQTVLGGNGNDTISTGDGNDRVYSGAGDDGVNLGAGNDVTVTGTGNDTVLGGDGHDQIRTDAGADTATGGDGNDNIDTGANADTADGGDGNDSVTTGAGDDRVTGGVGEDHVATGTGRDIADGGDGHDIIDANSGDDFATGGEGDDVINGGYGNDHINGVREGRFGPVLEDGGGGNDIINGGSGDDVIYGGDGSDTINPSAGDDTIKGGAGDDVLHGGPGNDTILAGAGNDRLIGGAGDDRLSGEAGDDAMYGGDGNDYVDGGDGNDIIRAEDGDDVAYGGAGYDAIDGGAGNDYLEGSEGRDTIHGRDGNDTLSGGKDNDAMYGDGGDDTFYTGHGEDEVSGGEGNDTAYAQDHGDHKDTISSVEDVVNVEYDPHIGSLIKVEGSPEFVSRVQADFEMLRSSPAGQVMLPLQDDIIRGWLFGIGDSSLTISEWSVERDEADERDGELYIKYNPALSLRGQGAYHHSPPAVILYHEFAHTYDFGTNIDVDGTYEGADNPKVDNRERQAVGLTIDRDGDGDYDDPHTFEYHPYELTENGLLEEMRRPLRDKY